MSVTVADGKSITSLDFTPDTSKGFIFFQGSLREIRDVHKTSGGVQIELYPKESIYERLKRL